MALGGRARRGSVAVRVGLSFRVSFCVSFSVAVAVRVRLGSALPGRFPLHVTKRRTGHVLARSLVARSLVAHGDRRRGQLARVMRIGAVPPC